MIPKTRIEEIRLARRRRHRRPTWHQFHPDNVKKQKKSK